MVLWWFFFFLVVVCLICWWVANIRRGFILDGGVIFWNAETGDLIEEGSSQYICFVGGSSHIASTKNWCLWLDNSAIKFWLVSEKLPTIVSLDMYSLHIAMQLATPLYITYRNNRSIHINTRKTYYVTEREAKKKHYLTHIKCLIFFSFKNWYLFVYQFWQKHWFL